MRFCKISPQLTTPSAPSKVASRHFIDGASTPPVPGGEHPRLIPGSRIWLRLCRVMSFVVKYPCPSTYPPIKVYEPQRHRDTKAVRPGLLESVHEKCLAHAIRRRGWPSNDRCCCRSNSRTCISTAGFG